MSNNVHFSANQITFIEWLATTKFERTPATQKLLADDLGVNEKTLTRWKQIPELKEAVTKRARELLGDDLPEIYGALRREAMQGSYQHIKLALELTGEYTETTRQTIQSLNIDISQLNDEQLERIAGGEDPAAVISSTSQG